MTKQFEVLEEVEKQHQACLKEPPNPDYNNEKWVWYIEQLNENPDMLTIRQLENIWSQAMDYLMMEESYDIDWPEDPAALAAEKEDQLEYIDNLFRFWYIAEADMEEEYKLMMAADKTVDDNAYEWYHGLIEDDVYYQHMIEEQILYIS